MEPEHTYRVLRYDRFSDTRTLVDEGLSLHEAEVLADTDSNYYIEEQPTRIWS